MSEKAAKPTFAPPSLRWDNAAPVAPAQAGAHLSHLPRNAAAPAPPHRRASTSSTHAGTSTPAAPSRVSSNHALPADGSRFSSSVAAP